MRLPAALAALAAALLGAPPLAERLFFTTRPFSPDDTPPPPDYAHPSSWAASPLHSQTSAAATWVPRGSGEAEAAHAARLDVFWLHPTTYFLGRWNAPADSPTAALVTDSVPVREFAGVFNGECRVFAPRYRQLSQGVQDRFPQSEQRAAMDVAFEDVWAAFEYFLEHTDGRPFFIGSYSQGTLHAMRLLQQWLRTAPAAQTARFVAWYGIGNTVPEAEMEGVLPVCTSATQTRCFISYNAVVEGDTAARDHWHVKGTPTCVNPLSWRQDELLVGKEHHLGAVPLLSSAAGLWRVLLYHILGAPSESPDEGLLTAQCRDGVLYVSDPSANKSVGHRYAFSPGVGLHALDTNLFWMNLRVNIRERAQAFFMEG